MILMVWLHDTRIVFNIILLHIMSRKYCIMTVWLSHSGKTTLAKNIIDHFSEYDIQQIDTDIIRAMCHHHIPNIYHNTWSGDVDINSLSHNNIDRMNLINRIQYTLLEYLIEFDKNIILSNGNTNKAWRHKIITLLQQYNYCVILVYVNTEEHIILERLSHTNKDTSLMLKSKTYKESYTRQKQNFEIPTAFESDHFIEYDGLNWDNVYQELSLLLHR